jgi:prolipoprotein diacylglyceryltransferase
MYRMIELGPAAMQTSLLIGLLSIFLATEIAARFGKRRGQHSGRIQNGILLGVVIGIISARVSYGLLNWEAYRDDFSSWVALAPQGLNPLIGAAVGITVLIAYIVWRGEKPRLLLDTLAPAIGIFGITLPLAFLADGSYFGQTSDLPWAIDLWGADRHPTQLYAALGGGLTLACWWFSREYRQHEGEGVLVIITGNSLTWLLVSFLIAEPDLILENYRTIQVVAWLALVGSIFAWNFWLSADEVSEDNTMTSQSAEPRQAQEASE